MSKVIKGHFLSFKSNAFFKKKNVKIPEFLSFPIQLAQLPLPEEAKVIFQRLPFEPKQLWPFFSWPADSIFSFEFLQQPLEWYLAFSVIFLWQITHQICAKMIGEKREKKHCKLMQKISWKVLIFFTCSSVSVAAFAMVSWVVLSVKALKHLDWFREM